MSKLKTFRVGHQLTLTPSFWPFICNILFKILNKTLRKKTSCKIEYSCNYYGNFIFFHAQWWHIMFELHYLIMEHKIGFDYLHKISKFFQIDSHGHSQCGRYESSVRQCFNLLRTILIARRIFSLFFFFFFFL